MCNMFIWYDAPTHDLHESRIIDSTGQAMAQWDMLLSFGNKRDDGDTGGHLEDTTNPIYWGACYIWQGSMRGGTMMSIPISRFRGVWWNGFMGGHSGFIWGITSSGIMHFGRDTMSASEVAWACTGLGAGDWADDQWARPICMGTICASIFIQVFAWCCVPWDFIIGSRDYLASYLGMGALVDIETSVSEV